MTDRQLEDELRIAEGMLLQPAERIPTAWGLCRSEDFTEFRCRLVYDALTSVWTLRDDIPWSPALALEVVMVAAARKWGGTAEEAYGVAEFVAQPVPCRDHLGDADGCYIYHCEAVAAAGAASRVRAALAHWYMKLTRPYVAGGPLDGASLPDIMPYRSTPAFKTAMRICETMQHEGAVVRGRTIDGRDARAVLAEVLKDIRATLRRTPSPPVRAAAHAVPEVGTW